MNHPEPFLCDSRRESNVALGGLLRTVEPIPLLHTCLLAISCVVYVGVLGKLPQAS